MDTSLTPPTVIPPALDPLANSHAADDYEAQLYEIFMEVFEAMVRPTFARVNLYGMPHRADFETIERFVKADGLAMERANAEPFMAELFRAWRARNPRRGLHFLRYYLQLLFPNRWTVTQLWQDPGQPYPMGGDDGQAAGRFLTSRVRVMLNGVDDPGSLGLLASSFLSVVPARIVLELLVRTDFEATMRIACAAVASETQLFSGTAST